MHRGSRLTQSILLAACLGTTNTVWGSDMSSAQETGAEKNIKVEISGSEETRYAARWTVTDSDGREQRYQESGPVPASYAYSGKAIAGQVTVLSESGRLQVEIRKNGNRSRSSTQGKGSRIDIRVQ